MNAITHDAAPRGLARNLGGRLIGAVLVGGARVLALARAWRERAEERRLFTQMDDRMLRDVGVSHAEMSMRLNAPFWRTCPRANPMER